MSVFSSFEYEYHLRKNRKCAKDDCKNKECSHFGIHEQNEHCEDICSYLMAPCKVVRRF